MELPRRILVGRGVSSEIGQFLKALDLNGRVLLVTGSNVRQKTEDSFSEALGVNGYDTVWVEVNSASVEEVKRVEDAAAKHAANIVVGVGGGKCVDVGKLVAHSVRKPFISVPTSASHDGISSPFASIRGMDKPYSMVSRAPLGVLADLDLISNAPPRLLASGCGDLVAKITAVRDWQLARDDMKEYYGEYAASLALLSAQIVMVRADDISRSEPDSIRGVVEALISAGVAAGIAGSSRPCSGGEHLFSHALSIIAPGVGLHGEKCGVGTIMISKLYEDDWEEIAESLRKVRAPTSAYQLGLSPEQVVKALVMAPTIRPERYTLLHKVKLDYDAALRLAKQTNVV